MTETHGTDINETVSIGGLEFSSQLNIGAAKWLERVTGKRIMQVAEALVAMEGPTFDVTVVSQVLTALYIAKHPGVDPKEAEAKVDTLTFPDMMEALGRVSPWEFEPKNSPPAPEATTEPTEKSEESTGQPSSTT